MSGLTWEKWVWSPEPQCKAPYLLFPEHGVYLKRSQSGRPTATTLGSLDPGADVFVLILLKQLLPFLDLP